MQRRMFWFDKEDDKALTTIMREYRCETKSQAVRLALNLVATGRVADVPERAISARNYRRRSRKSANRPVKKHVLLALLELAQKHPIEGLPEDFSENLDEYLYGHLRPQT